MKLMSAESGGRRSRVCEQPAGSGDGQIGLFDDQIQEIPAGCGAILPGQTG